MFLFGEEENVGDGGENIFLKDGKKRKILVIGERIFFFIL